MASALDSGSSGPGLSAGQPESLSVVFLGSGQDTLRVLAVPLSTQEL